MAVNCVRDLCASVTHKCDSLRVHPIEVDKSQIVCQIVAFTLLSNLHYTVNILFFGQ